MQLVIDHLIVNYQTINDKEKETVVILHGWGQNSNHWLELGKLLDKNYRYLLLDLPGFGQSHLLTDNPGIPQYSEFLLKVFNKLKIKEPILLGHSFGGQISMYFAANHKNKIKTLILLSPAGIRTKTKKQKLKNYLYKNFKLFKFIFPSFLLKKIIRLFTSTDFLNASAQHRQILNNIVNQDLRYLLKDITTPTHIIWGEQDKEIPYHGKTLAEQIPDSTLHVLYGADHNPQLFKPQMLAKTINDILSQ